MSYCDTEDGAWDWKCHDQKKNSTAIVQPIVQRTATTTSNKSMPPTIKTLDYRNMGISGSQLGTIINQNTQAAAKQGVSGVGLLNVAGQTAQNQELRNTTGKNVNWLSIASGIAGAFGAVNSFQDATTQPTQPSQAEQIAQQEAIRKEAEAKAKQEQNQKRKNMLMIGGIVAVLVLGIGVYFLTKKA